MEATRIPWEAYTQGVGVLAGAVLIVVMALITSAFTPERMYASCMVGNDELTERVDGKAYADEAEAWSETD